MAEAISTPRINFSYLDSFTNRTVRLIGKVIQLRGEEATIDAGGHVTAHLNRVRICEEFGG
jgi:replication factor A3